MNAPVDAPSRRNRARNAHPPEAMIRLPDNNADLVKVALEVIGVCREDAGQRAAFCRQMDLVVKTGREDGSRSLINLLYRMLDRLASHLFSPTDIRFSTDFEYSYDQNTLRRGEHVARLLSRSWERTNTDLLFATGVFEALKYGGVVLKQWPSEAGPDRTPHYNASLVMPWQFGVYKPDQASLDAQPAMVETVSLTLPEVWRRIHQMPDAADLFDKIKAAASPENVGAMPSSFAHSVLSTAPIQTGVSGNNRPIPGGTVQIGSGETMTGMTASSSAPRVLLHELWMWDGEDYTTIQIVEPDILIAPRFRRSNLIFPGMKSGLHPYSLIQPNAEHGNIWGRSELADLIDPQGFLSATADDIRRLFGVQVDKFLGITGDDLTDERYDQARAAGYVNLGQNGSVTDLTPRFPAEALPLIDKIIGLMEMISGFDNLLSGRGESGVRSGAQSNPLMAAAGAPLKDRSLIIERQCAAAADLRLHMMEAKDGRTYWTDPDHIEDTSFLLSDLPDDRRVVVDGHTTSPIFADAHQNLIIGGTKMGLVDPESAIEQLPFQNKEILLSRLRAKQRAAAAQMEALKKDNPEEYYKILEKQVGGARRR